MMWKLASLIGAAAAVEDLQACMYCKYQDTNSGLMRSYSYCGDREDQRCIQDFWEYIQP